MAAFIWLLLRIFVGFTTSHLYSSNVSGQLSLFLLDAAAARGSRSAVCISSRLTMHTVRGKLLAYSLKQKAGALYCMLYTYGRLLWYRLGRSKAWTLLEKSNIFSSAGQCWFHICILYHVIINLVIMALESIFSMLRLLNEIRDSKTANFFFFF